MKFYSILAFALVFILAFSLFGCTGNDDVYPPNKTKTHPDDVYPPNKTNASITKPDPVNITQPNTTVSPPKYNATTPPPGNTNTSQCNWQSPTKISTNNAKLTFQTDVSIDAIDISNNGWRAVAGAQDYKIYYFKRDSAKPYFTYETGDQVNSVSMADDGKNLVAGSYDGKIYYFECDEKIPKWIYDTTKDTMATTVESVDITADGKWIAAVSKSHFYLFDSNSNTPAMKLDLSKKVWALATVTISDDGSKAVVGSIPDGKNGQVFYLDLKTKQLLWQYNITDLGWVSGVPIPVAISHYGNDLAAGGPDLNIYYWKANSPNPQWKYKIADEGSVYSVSLSGDGKKLAATGYYRLFYFGDTSSGKPTMTYDGYYKDPFDSSRTGSWDIGNYLHAVDQSYDASKLIVGDYVYGHFFTIQNGNVQTVKMHDLAYDVDPVGAVEISSDGSWAIISSTFYGEIQRLQLS